VRSGLGRPLSPLEGAVFEVRAPEGRLSPQLRLGLLHAQGSLEISQGAASLSWTAAQLEVCPIRFAVARPMAFVPCIAINGGVLSGSGSPNSRVGTGRSASNLWLEGAFALRFELELLRALSLQAEGQAGVPLIRYHFDFKPDTPIYSVPLATASALIGLVARFP
jgi:hypothetical protein